MVFFIPIAYLLGSIPFGFLIAKTVKNVDIRRTGSGNIGATNVFRVVGKKWGGGVLALDCLKGYFGVKLPLWLGFQPSSLIFPLVFGIAAILGHSFPVWLRFRGGKGVATSLGVFLAIAFLPTVFTFAIWGFVFICFRIISLASLIAAGVFPLMVFATERSHPEFVILFSVSCSLTLFIFYTHRSNVGRLLRGEEKRLL